VRTKIACDVASSDGQGLCGIAQRFVGEYIAAVELKPIPLGPNEFVIMPSLLIERLFEQRASPLSAELCAA